MSRAALHSGLAVLMQLLATFTLIVGTFSELSMVTSMLMLFCRNAGESVWCTVIFVTVYYFTIAGVFWFAILAYTWHLTFRTYSSKHDVIEGRKGYFHLAAWTPPLVLTIVCLAITQVSIIRVTLFLLPYTFWFCFTK